MMDATASSPSSKKLHGGDTVRQEQKEMPKTDNITEEVDNGTSAQNTFLLKEQPQSPEVRCF